MSLFHSKLFIDVYRTLASHKIDFAFYLYIENTTNNAKMTFFMIDVG